MNKLAVATVGLVGLAQSVTYPGMYCLSDDAYRNGMDGYHNNVNYNMFLNGMDSNHENYYEDREFKWRYCRPSSDWTPVEGTQTLSQTAYDAEWTRSCATINGGNAAMIGAVSSHHNYYEDRLWTWYCGNLDGSFALANCAWSGIVNEWDADVNFECDDNGVIRSVWSQHHNYYEDRKWNFECCRVIDTGCSNCAMENDEIASDGLDTEPVKDNAPFWEELSTGAIVAIIAAICVVIAALVLVLVARYRSRKFVEVSTNDEAFDEEEEDEVDQDVVDGLDEEINVSAEIVSVVEGTETQREANSSLHV